MSPNMSHGLAIMIIINVMNVFFFDSENNHPPVTYISLLCLLITLLLFHFAGY